MPREAKARFVLLYGSQKGQAQSIAEGVAEEAEERGLVADLCCLDQSEKYNLETERAPVVFVVSTTGDGEPPDNALRFVKSIKERTLSPDHYKHLLYALLALGDTNYANFCNCGKTIERRLQQLGAKQFYPTGYADDGVGLELVIDPWLEGLWNAIKDAVSKMASDGNRDDAAREIPDPSIPDIQLNLLSIGDKQNREPDSKYAPPSVVSDARPASSAVSAGLTSRPTSAVSQARGEGAAHVSLAASLRSSLPPLSESSLNVPALPPPYLDVTFRETDAVEQAFEPSSKETLYQVPISKAVQLSKGDSVKTALLLELDISGCPSLTYQPGDAFDVFCPNRAEEVDQLLHRLGLQDQRNHRVQITLREDTKKKGAQVPPHIPQNVPLLFLLTWCLEIRSVPKKAFLRALVEHTSDSGQRRRLQELCSKQGASDYSLYVREPSLSVSELLAAFPSCSPPLSLLIELLPKLQPRPYSAASSRLRHPEKLRFVFSVVEFPACSGRPAGRRGLCTGWLSDLVNPGLALPVKAESPGSPAPPKIHVSLRPNCSFRLPPDPSVPFIMIGPGTGVAPFIGFLQQREEERTEKPEAEFGETWLFFGCRYRDRDYLFREELEHFVSSGTLNHLKVCFSREDRKDEQEPPSAAQPRYVQHNLLLCRQQVSDILLRQNGYIYVCGDAKNMAKEVNETLVEMIKTELQVDQLEAMKTLAGLRDEKRYLQDIWA